MNPNAGTRKAEQTKTDKYGLGLLCRQRGMDFVPIIFTTSGGMGEQSRFQRRYWNPHWIRVAEEDEAMKIGPWVARKAFWEARFAVVVANCNAGMISRSQHITD